MNATVLAFLTAFTVYLLIPGLAAFIVLRQWRTFRARVVESTLFPLLGYAGIRSSSLSSRFRFYGTLEALEGKNYLWLKEEGGKATVRVDMHRQGFWMIPDEGEPPSELRGDAPGTLNSAPPQWVSWSEASALTEGSKFYVFGPVDPTESQVTFHGTAERLLLVLLYEGNPEDLIRRCIWTGRQKNEYWNSVTPLSFAFGLVVLGVMGFLWSLDPATRESARWALALAVLPETFFLPPGLAFFFAFNRFWARGRWYRALRDMIRLPFRYWGAIPSQTQEPLQTTLPGGEKYQICRHCRCALQPNPLAQKIFWKKNRDSYPHQLAGEGKDPAVTPFQFDGEPRDYFAQARKNARRGELLALGFFILGAGANLMVLYLVFRYWFL